MSPLPWLLIIIPLLQSTPAEIALVGVESVSIQFESAESRLFKESLSGETFREVSRAGTTELESSDRQSGANERSAVENRNLSRWGWSIGQNLISQPQVTEEGHQPFGREALVEHYLETSRLIQLRHLPLDAVFQPLGADPLLHAPPWWEKEPGEIQDPTFSCWACEVPAEQADGLLRAGLGVTLEVGAGASWDCRFTTNIDQQGEAGFLLQFCWH